MNKKSQTAMEFLMTYGWAILVVLAAISALAYFGVLKPNQFLPEKCMLDVGVACIDFKITSNEITMLILNSLGRNIEVSDITIGNCTTSFNQTLNNGYKFTFILSGCNNGLVDSRFKSNVEIFYINKGSMMSKTIKGSIVGKVN
jgi:hypothetical protein